MKSTVNFTLGKKSIGIKMLHRAPSVEVLIGINVDFLKDHPCLGNLFWIVWVVVFLLQLKNNILINEQILIKEQIFVQSYLSNCILQQACVVFLLSITCTSSQSDMESNSVSCRVCRSCRLKCNLLWFIQQAACLTCTYGNLPSSSLRRIVRGEVPRCADWEQMSKQELS